MIIDGLQRRKREESDRLANGHERHRVGDSCAQCVEQQALEPVVVQCPESIWDIQSVMHGMERPVQILVCVEVSVEEVLPSIYHKAVEADGE